MNTDKEHEAFGLVIEHQKSRASENDILDQPNPNPYDCVSPDEELRNGSANHQSSN